MLSRNGVCYDLEKSHYRCTKNNVTFIFSSRLHLEKFESKYKQHRETVNKSLTKRFNLKVNVDSLADVVLYRKIETRGFLIEVEGEFQCPENLTCDGVRVRSKMT